MYRKHVIFYANAWITCYRQHNYTIGYSLTNKYIRFKVVCCMDTIFLYVPRLALKFFIMLGLKFKTYSSLDSWWHVVKNKFNLLLVSRRQDTMLSSKWTRGSQQRKGGKITILIFYFRQKLSV